MFRKGTTVLSSTRISESKDHYPKCRYITQLTVYGDYSVATKVKLVEILYFKHFYGHFTFGETDLNLVWTFMNCISAMSRRPFLIDKQKTSA